MSKRFSSATGFENSSSAYLTPDDQKGHALHSVPFYVDEYSRNEYDDLLKITLRFIRKSRSNTRYPSN